MKTLEQNEVVYLDDEEAVDGATATPLMDIVPFNIVNEGNIYEVGYSDNKNALVVHFKTIQKTVEGFELGVRTEPIIYVYHDVDRQLFDDFLNSENKVQFFNDNIKSMYCYHKEEIFG